MGEIKIYKLEDIFSWIKMKAAYQILWDAVKAVLNISYKCIY